MPNSTSSFDPTTFSTNAMNQGGETFIKTILLADPASMEKSQLAKDEHQAEQRARTALVRARSARSAPEPHLLSVVNNWAKKQAIVLLGKKAAGKPIPQDYYTPFLDELRQEIENLVSDLVEYWLQEDEEREAAAREQAAATRAEAERAFGEAYGYIRGLGQQVLSGEQERRAVFSEGQQLVKNWSDLYEGSMRWREEQLEARVQRIEQQEKENRAHQLALRSLARWDEKVSFARNVASTGKQTMGCLLLWLVPLACLLLLLYLAFPHH